MAYVAKSGKVWDAIERNIEALFKERKKHVAEWSTYTDLNAFFEMCYRFHCPEAQEAIANQLPTSWLGPKKDFTFKFKISTPEKDSPWFSHEANTKRRYPSNTDYNDAFLIHESKMPDAMKAIVIGRATQMLAVQNEEKVMIATAKQVYDKVKSVNQFVKLWEPALHLLPKETVDKLRAVTERASAAEERGISQEELNALNASFTKAKIAQ